MEPVVEMITRESQRRNYFTKLLSKFSDHLARIGARTSTAMVLS